MVTPTVGAVVLVPFPFSDLSNSKLRPAIVLADAGRGDFVLCQVTSKPYMDVSALAINNHSFSNGSLRILSYARPGKLFTANENLFTAQVGILSDEAFKKVIDSVIALLKNVIT